MNPEIDVDRPSPRDFRVGQRVELHPCCDLWMRGARFGTVEKIGRRKVHVSVDRLARTLALHPANLLDA